VSGQLVAEPAFGSHHEDISSLGKLAEEFNFALDPIPLSIGSWAQGVGSRDNNQVM
jgi:hypothetical protein